MTRAAIILGAGDTKKARDGDDIELSEESRQEQPCSFSLLRIQSANNSMLMH